jgi:urease accessory protein UreE
MICDRILGNIESDPATWAGVARDIVEFTWFECFRRGVKKRTTSGQTIRLLPPLGTTVRHGDVIAHDEAGGIVVVVNVTPCELLSAQPSDLPTMGVIAAELGNLHIPLELLPDGTLLALPDGPAEGVLRRHGVRYERVATRFSPLRASVPEEFRLADDFKLTRRDNE